MHNPVCRFGIELPCYVADIFLNKPDRYFSLRRMPDGVEVPRQPHDAEVMAGRVREIGADFVGYNLKPHDFEGAVNAARWARQHRLSLLLNNPACQITADPTPGFNTWVYDPELVNRVKAETDLIGLLYDEMNHHQLHPGMGGHTNPWNSLADVSDCESAGEAYRKVEAGLKNIFGHTEKTGIPALTEEVVPALFHATARAGGYPGCKVMKEQNTPLSLSICMSAAHQYRTSWYGTVDLWEGDSGPWYQVLSRCSGHNVREFLSALKLMVLLNPYAAMVEGADLLWVADSPGAEITEFGETMKKFMKDIRPKLAPAFDHLTWKPTVAIVHCEDGNYEEPVPEGVVIDTPYFFPELTRMLLGAPKVRNSKAATKWLKAWYHLTWGKCSGKTLHNYFNPLEVQISHNYDVGGSEHDIFGCPPIEKRRDSARKETHMHTLFTPLNNTAVFDGYVREDQLESARLILLCGSYATPEAQQAVLRAVEKGAVCLCQEECSPAEMLEARGAKIGAGYWWTVPDFDSPDALEQLLMYRGCQNQWTLLSDLGLLRIYSTDPWGNEIAWELEKGRTTLEF